MNKGRSELGMKMLDKVCECVCVRARVRAEASQRVCARVVCQSERDRERFCLFDGVRERESFGHDDDKTRMMTRKETNQYEIGHCKECLTIISVLHFYSALESSKARRR